MSIAQRTLRQRCPVVAALVAGLGAAGLLLPLVARADVANGNFEAGDTGFTTAYSKGTTSSFGPGNYVVDTNPIKYNANFGYSVADHTSGSGLELIFDGSTSANVTAWSQNVAVTPNTSYTFSYWTSAWGNDNHNGLDPFPPKLAATANGTLVGSVLNLPAQDGLWTHFTGTFNSGAASSVTLAIVDQDTDLPGNDFVLDDMSVTPTPEPAAGALLLGAACLLGRRRRRQP